jgi:hypothetical protein
MDIIQKAATMALLTLVVYFVMVNIVDHGKGDAVPSSGIVKASKKPSQSEIKDKGIRSNLGIDNKLNLEANNTVTIEGINTTVGVHTRTTVGEPVVNTEANVTELAVFDEQSKGVLAVNHDLFEKPANFGSDITNINQFYRNNPEIFDKSMNGGAYVPDVESWANQGQELYDTMSQKTHQGPVKGYNYEDRAFPALMD